MQGDNLRSTGVQNAVCQTYSDALNTDKIFTDLKIDKLRSVFDTKREKSDASDREKSEKTSLPRSDTVATKQRAGQLFRQKIAQPDSIGMYWGNRDERQWNEGYEEARRYFDANGDLNVPADHVSPDRYATGKWAEQQREREGQNVSANHKLKKISVCVVDSAIQSTCCNLGRKI